MVADGGDFDKVELIPSTVTDEVSALQSGSVDAIWIFYGWAGIACEVDHMNRSIKAQFKYADKLQAKYVAVIGGNELAQGVMNVKNMSDSTQESVPFEQATAYFSR